jgi:hypothetical protein
LRGSAVGRKYTGDLGYRPIQIVVNDHVIGQLAPDALFLAPESDPPLDLFGRVPPPAHALRLMFDRRRHDEDDDGLGVELFDLPGPFDVDLE